MNYQRELDMLLAKLEKSGGSSQAFASQLLCALQQLCAGIFK